MTFLTERVARKIIRMETSALKKAIAPYRSEIAALKRRTHLLEQQIRRSQKVVTRAVSHGPVEEPSSLRFSAEGLAKHRQRLGLSQKDYGALVRASGLSVYKWEQGGVRPRQRYLTAIAAIRKIGKREAASRLNEQGA